MKEKERSGGRGLAEIAQKLGSKSVSSRNDRIFVSGGRHSVKEKGIAELSHKKKRPRSDLKPAPVVEGRRGRVANHRGIFGDHAGHSSREKQEVFEGENTTTPPGKKCSTLWDRGHAGGRKGGGLEKSYQAVVS